WRSAIGSPRISNPRTSTMPLPALVLALFLQPQAASQDVDTPKDPPAVAATDEAQARTPQPPPPTPRPSRRRGSLVGHIADPTVGTQIRLRFDAGRHNDVPDRAEFFYAKCGCYRDLVAIPAAAALGDKDAPGPGGGIVQDLNYQQAYLRAELGFMRGRA